MPFAVFRRHQRKLIAIFGILAMFAFVLADSLPRLLNADYATDIDPVVVELYGRPVRSSEVGMMAAERRSYIGLADTWTSSSGVTPSLSNM